MTTYDDELMWKQYKQISYYLDITWRVVFDMNITRAENLFTSDKPFRIEIKMGQYNISQASSSITYVKLSYLHDPAVHDNLKTDGHEQHVEAALEVVGGEAVLPAKKAAAAAAPVSAGEAASERRGPTERVYKSVHREYIESYETTLADKLSTAKSKVYQKYKQTNKKQKSLLYFQIINLTYFQN
ncbi:Protein of unknown function [Gryllus bimaculatus]|nr:Protein of unknown function [Gryllus bimaculatus]